jgi:hypothetical protein
MSERLVRRSLPVLALIFLSAAPALAQNGPYRFSALTPCRVVDTRQPAFAPALAAGSTRSFTIKGVCGVPAEAKAAALNITAVNPTHSGHLRVFPSDVALPNASTLNFQASSVIANGAIVPLDPDSTPDLSVFAFLSTAGGTVHFVADVTGYFAPVAP